MRRRLWALIQKEFIQLFRERRMVFAFIVGVPLEMILFAAAIHTDVKHIAMVVADQSRSSASRSYLNAFTSSESFDIVAMVSGQADVNHAIDSGQANLGLVIPPDFVPRVAHGDASVLMLVDGSSSYTTQAAYNAANAISQAYAVSLIGTVQQRGSGPQSGALSSPLTAHIQILYNPDLKDMWFITPAFIAMLLFAASEGLTALAIVRERERGTIEALLVTPVRPFELMIAKMIPSLVVTFLSAVMLMLVGTLVLGVPFRGNLLLFAGLALVDCGCGLGLGLAISSATQTQNQAQQLHSLFNITGMFLGGVLFPAYALPLVLRILSYVFPSSYFVPIVRGMALKGIGFAELWPQALALVVLLATTLFVATRLFRQRLD